MRRFEFVEGASRKFWEIGVVGAAFTVRYGRLGTDGQSSTKTFDTKERAAAEAEKLVREKVGKGYREVRGKSQPAAGAKRGGPPSKTELPGKPARSKAPNASASPAAKAASRDVERLIKKIASGRGTAGTYEAVIDAAALLALAGDVGSALEAFRLLWKSPDRVHRLLVAGEDARADSHATHLYKKLGAQAAAEETAKALGISKAQLLLDVREREAELKSTLLDHQSEPSVWGSGKGKKDTAKAFAMLKQAGQKRRSGEVFTVALELLERGDPHPYALLQRRLIVAECAFAAGAKADALRIITRAAEAEREETDTIYSILEVLLSFEWSARALRHGEIVLAPLDARATKRLIVTVKEFFARVAGPASPNVEWRPLLTKLAGARTLRSGAAAGRIQALEKRLRLKLPPTYREFLATSDGLGKGRKSLALCSADEVGWFRDKNRSWIDAYRAEGADIPQLEGTLQISEAREGEVYLLNPSLEVAGEWEAWHFANHVPGETRFTSFLELIHNLLDAS